MWSSGLTWCSQPEYRLSGGSVQMLCLEGCNHADGACHVMVNFSAAASNRARWAYGGQIFAWMSCLHSRTVSAVASASCDCMCLRSTALNAAEAAADSTDCHVYLLSLQTAIPSVKLQLFIFSLFLNQLFSWLRMHYSAYYSVQVEYE